MLLHRLPLLAKLIGYTVFASIWLFLLTRFFTFWLEWPTITEGFSIAFNSGGASGSGADNDEGWKSFAQFGLSIMLVIAVLVLSWVSRQRQLHADAVYFSKVAAYIVRAAFWSVFLVGFADAIISLARIEGWLVSWVGVEMTEALGRAQYRGTYVHYPLVGLAMLIAIFQRGVSFVWLSLLVILAEFAIVIARFVFSYEQTFMGDLVRFWYAALFLFASAFTLLNDSHVRVDVLFAGFSRRAKSRINAYGSLLLGLPVCGVILWLGMATKQSSLLSPVLNFEISQSGYGMYVKYLMSLFLVVFAVTMAIQFISYFFAGLSILRNEGQPALFDEAEAEEKI